MKHLSCLIALLLIACGKDQEAPKAEPKAAAAPKPAPEIKLPPTPQGKLPQMDPAKAKFIAVPSTPKDPEVKKDEKTADEIKKAAPAQTQK